MEKWMYIFFLMQPKSPNLSISDAKRKRRCKHTTIRGKGKNPEVEKVQQQKRSHCKFNTFSLRTKSHMRYIVYAIYRIYDISHMQYGKYHIYDISHMRYGKPFSSIKT